MMLVRSNSADPQGSAGFLQFCIVFSDRDGDDRVRSSHGGMTFQNQIHICSPRGVHSHRKQKAEGDGIYVEPIDGIFLNSPDIWQ